MTLRILPLLLLAACANGPGKAGPDTLGDDLPTDASAIVINEIDVKDPFGGPDFIELHNPSSTAVALGGALLSALDQAVQQDWTFPEGTTIDAGGYLVLYCDQGEHTEIEGLHTSFRLATEGGTLVFVYPTDEGLGTTRATYGGTARARVPDDGDWFSVVDTTRGRANGALVLPTAGGTLTETGDLHTDTYAASASCTDPEERIVVELDTRDVYEPDFLSVRFEGAMPDWNVYRIEGYTGDGVVDAWDFDSTASQGLTAWTADDAWGVYVRPVDGWLGLRISAQACSEAAPVEVSDVELAIVTSPDGPGPTTGGDTGSDTTADTE